MLFSTNEQLEKLSWLKENSESFSNTRLKSQKFLFFYEMFSGLEKDEYNTSYLRAYMNGPVYSNVYGDMRYSEVDLNKKIAEIDDYSSVDVDIANATKYLLDLFNEKELSELTHSFDLWSSKKNRIKANEKQISINEEDISERDKMKLHNLLKRYQKISKLDIDILNVQNKIFVISKEDKKEMKPEHDEVLEILSQDEELENPVYLSLKDGVLLVD